MLQLPPELLVLLSQFLDIKDITTLCLLCRTVSLIFQNELWQHLRFDQQPPVRRAVNHGRVDMASQFLLRYGADVNAMYRGFTPLSLAVMRRNMAAVNFLLQQTAIDVKCQDVYGLDVLSRAVEMGDASMVERLLCTSRIDVNTLNQTGTTPAMYALGIGQTYILQFLLQDSRTDVNRKSISGQALLHLASARPDPVAIQILVRHRQIDVNAHNVEGDTPLLIAAKGLGREGFDHAIVCLLQSTQIDVNVRDANGHTPLWYAIQSSHETVVELILQRDSVDLSSCDHVGTTPLTFAVQRGSKSLVKRILRHPASTQEPTGAAVCAIWAACQSGQTDIVRILLRWKSINVNRKSPIGTSPLQVAIINQHLPVVSLLLEECNRIAVNDQGPQGWTALTFAAAGGQDQMVARILRCPGIEVNTKDSDGKTVLLRNGSQLMIEECSNFIKMIELDFS